MLTLTDPRLTLWERRKVTLAKLATLRTYRASTVRMPAMQRQ